MGRPTLTENPKVTKVARAHSLEMAGQMTIYHNEKLATELPPFKAAGENVGMGSDCASVAEAFRNSPGHYANIVDPDYTQMGVGVYRNGDTIYVTEDFINPKVTAPPRSSQPSPNPRPTTSGCLP